MDALCKYKRTRKERIIEFKIKYFYLQKTCAFNTESMKKVFNVFPRKFVYTYCTQQAILD